MSRRSKFIQALSGWRALPRSPKELTESVRLLATLREAGWQSGLRDKVRFSFEASQPVLTYGAIGFLESFLNGNSRVLEFGTGGSTVWLASRVGLVVSIEHDERWSDRIPAISNLDLRIVPCLGNWYNDDPGSNYSRAAAGDSPYDAIIVDGMARTDCAREALSLVASDGIIVLDDLHDPLIEPAIQILKEHGFESIDFWGLRPGSGQFGGTGVFYGPRIGDSAKKTASNLGSISILNPRAGTT
jgi:hypothetical protein